MIEAERRALSLNGLRQLGVLIRYWTHREPSDDPIEFMQQAAEALWIEERVNGLR